MDKIRVVLVGGRDDCGEALLATDVSEPLPGHEAAVPTKYIFTEGCID